MLEDWRSTEIVPLCKDIGKKTECKNYRGIILSVVGKIYMRIIVDSVCRLTEGLVDDKQRGGV